MKKLNLKKFLSLLLTLTMCLSLVTSAMALEDGEGEPANPAANAEPAGTTDTDSNDPESTDTDSDDPESDKPSVEDLKGKAEQAEKIADENQGNVFYTPIDQQLEKAKEDNKAAEEKSAEVTGAVESVETNVKTAVDAAQKEIDDSEKENKPLIEEATEEIEGETQKVVTAVDEANEAVQKVRDQLAKLETEDLTPQEKADAADAAVKAAEDAQELASAAKDVVKEADTKVEAAVSKADAAKKAYDDAVKAAEKAVGDAKAKAEEDLATAKETLEAAKEDLAKATEAKATADKAKKNADKALEDAQDALAKAQEIYEDVKWPKDPEDKDGDYSRDNVTEEKVEKKKYEAASDLKCSQDNTEFARKWGLKIDELNGQVETKAQEKLTTEGTKTTTESTRNGLIAENETLATQKNTIVEAQTAYETRCGEVEEAYKQDIETAKSAYKTEADKLSKDNPQTAQDLGWGDGDVALIDSSQPGGWNYLEYHGKRIKNSEFAYYLAVDKALYGEESQVYKDLQEYYNKWRDETDPQNGDERKAPFFSAKSKK